MCSESIGSPVFLHQSSFERTDALVMHCYNSRFILVLLFVRFISSRQNPSKLMGSIHPWVLKIVPEEWSYWLLFVISKCHRVFKHARRTKVIFVFPLILEGYIFNLTTNPDVRAKCDIFINSYLFHRLIANWVLWWSHLERKAY